MYWCVYFNQRELDIRNVSLEVLKIRLRPAGFHQMSEVFFSVDVGNSFS